MYGWGLILTSIITSVIFICSGSTDVSAFIIPALFQVGAVICWNIDSAVRTLRQKD